MLIRGVSMPDSVLSPAPTAWPAPAGTPVLLFGGTFDPPHRAHVELPTRARDTLFGDEGWLVYVPAARNPHKNSGPIAPDADRVEMLRLATKGVPRCSVWTDEIDRAGAGAAREEPSYWVDTLARAASLVCEETPLRFLIGADQVLAFERWHEHEKIVALAEPAVMLREPVPNREAFRRQLQMSGMGFESWMRRVVFTGTRAAASTDARAVLAVGGNTGEMIDDEVLAYIRRRGLYGNE
ncbi:MAG: nicotinate-nicotinamide nucleotide adenylyltransferase [Phycisphaerales bacterium]|nr:nicotinate-nicotinamide nucleotide adenylyltransferase [Phycisphaerales bacterium]